MTFPSLHPAIDNGIQAAAKISPVDFCIATATMNRSRLP